VVVDVLAALDRPGHADQVALAEVLAMAWA
jgi:hypothetical protein